MGSNNKWTDERSVHCITRGNVDGLVASAFVLAAHPEARVSYVPSANGAVDRLRRDLSSERIIVADLGLTPRLIKTLNGKADTDQRVLVLDHHQQTGHHGHGLHRHVDVAVHEGPSAAAVALDHLTDESLLAASSDLQGLAAIADVVDHCESQHLHHATNRWGRGLLEDEAQMLDFAWRLRIDDDRFRRSAARRMASGSWPSEIEEVRRRYLQVVNEKRWPRARARARESLDVLGPVAVLDTSRHRTNLLGFGSRALTAAARDRGCRLAARLNSRGRDASVSLRATQPLEANLGQFLEEFTQEHGIAGGGHPHAAGARIPSREVPTLLHALAGLVASA